MDYGLIPMQVHAFTHKPPEFKPDEGDSWIDMDMSAGTCGFTYAIA